MSIPASTSTSQNHQDYFVLFNSVILISCKYLVFRCRYHFINTILTDQCMHTPTFTKFYFKNVYFHKILQKYLQKSLQKYLEFFKIRIKYPFFSKISKNKGMTPCAPQKVGVCSGLSALVPLLSLVPIIMEFQAKIIKACIPW